MRAKRQTGFTLLEILIALGILALTLSALVRSSAENTSSASYLRDRTIAHWVAMNRVAEQQLTRKKSGRIRSQGSELMAGESWEWRTKLEKTPDPDILRLQVSVWLNDPEAPLSKLTAFVPKR